MGRIDSPTLTVLAVALATGCSSVSDGDASFWEPSRDLGGRKFGGFGQPGGTNSDGGTNSGGSGNAGGESGSGSGQGGAGGTGAVGGNSGSGGADPGGAGPGGTGPGGAGPGGSAGTGGTGPGGSAGTGAGGGEGTACKVTFDVTTVTYRGRFGPKNVGAIWVMNGQNQFVKTLAVWAGIRGNNLVNWQRQAAGNKVDAVTAATISNHRAHPVTWDCTKVPNGSYKMLVEFTEDDSALFFNPQPKLFSFDFQKGAPATLSPPAQPNFTSMTFSIQ